MKERLEPFFNKKIIRIISFILILFFSCLGTAFSYSYGTTKASNGFYASLMSLDSKIKNQKQTSFGHGMAVYKDGVSESDTYKTNFELQKRTRFKYQNYNSFLVSSADGNPIAYNVDCKVPNLEWTASNLLEVSTYYDKNYMESIGLPLFNVDLDNPSRITQKNGAQCGAYISASCAEQIVTNNGLLEKCGGDISKAFASLISDETFLLEVSSEKYKSGETITMTINNIYIDSSHTELFNEFQRKVQYNYYGDYSKSIDYWFKDAIFTYSYDIFSKESTYFFDIRKNYGNLDLFFRDVLEYDYATKDIAITIFDENGIPYTESKQLNDFSLNIHKNPNYVFLSLSILSFVFSLILFNFSFAFYEKKAKIILSILPLLPFAICQIVFCMVVIPINFVLAYSFFNSTGNMLNIIFTFIFSINVMLWWLYGKKSIV